ncbi:MAG: 2-amino-4-hydroxy-6-hydroxymethyldihydropteridine diphosphokinase [Gammaproteobacteria bacterium]|nr:2-amino-4-hydroxy-6-hydroxymethyldihydropteridine diphosphokinase [Gammaproteobacteria bacterium]
MTDTYIGIGSNLDDPCRHVLTANQHLAALTGTQWIRSSSLYASSPMGPQDQPDYINAVAMVKTALTPHQLLTELQAIEHYHGRERKRHWGERTLDLDILVYGDLRIVSEQLTIPHVGIGQRAFVIFPLYDIAPTLHIAGLGSVQHLKNRLQESSIRKLPITISSCSGGESNWRQ